MSDCCILCILYTHTIYCYQFVDICLLLVNLDKTPGISDQNIDLRFLFYLQNVDKHPSKSHPYNDRYDPMRESPSYNRHRDESPDTRPSPRYHNKSSYMEREKHKLERGTWWQAFNPFIPADIRNKYLSTPILLLKITLILVINLLNIFVWKS